MRRGHAVVAYREGLAPANSRVAQHHGTEWLVGELDPKYIRIGTDGWHRWVEKMTTVAFWNVNMGNGNDLGARQRRKAFRDWVQWATPDVLFLEEVSATLLPAGAGVAPHDGIPAGARIAQIAGMTYVAHVETLQRGARSDSTKNIVGLRSAALAGGGAIRGRALRMHSSAALERVRMRQANARAAQGGVRGRDASGLHIQPRMALKLTGIPSLGGGFEAIGVHAKSGGGGRGRQGVAWALDYLRNARDTVIGGDFNFDFANIVFPTDRAGLAPVLYGGAAAPFTQWAKDAGGYHPAHLLGAISLPAYQQPTFTVQPHDVIDYILYNDVSHMVTALNCMPPPAIGLGANGSLWRDILRSFDHMPVVYNVI